MTASATSGASGHLPLHESAPSTAARAAPHAAAAADPRAAAPDVQPGTAARTRAPDTRSTAARARATRLSLFDGATLAAIALLVVLVSLPRLRRFALRENETDAIRALRVLAADATAATEALATGHLGALLPATGERRARLEDVEVLADGRLRRHGYLFAAAGRGAIVAWPWEHGRTGLGAFAIEPGREPVGIANQAGSFSGPTHPPPAPGEPVTEAWRSAQGL